MMVAAVLMFSTSAVLVRWAMQDLHPVTVTAARMFLGSLTAVALGLFLRRTWSPPPRREWGRYALYGLIAAAHFGLYVTALDYTTIAHALSITYTAPIWVTLFTALFLHEPFPIRKWPGVLLTVLGIAILAGFEPEFDRRMLVGDVMALGSAICFGFYSVAGRSQRQSTSVFTYSGAVYGVAALWLAAPGVLLYRPGSLTWTAAAAVLGASVLPLGIGHTLYNAALRRLHPTMVNVIATQEVTGGVLLGMLLLKEIPSPAALVGAAVALAGVLWTLLR